MADADAGEAAGARIDKIAGVILGTAVGDALGLPREDLARRRARRLFGDSPLRHRLLFARGMVRDDTEHTCMTGQALLRAPDDACAFARSLAWRLRFCRPGLPGCRRPAPAPGGGRRAGGPRHRAREGPRGPRVGRRADKGWKPLAGPGRVPGPLEGRPPGSPPLTARPACVTAPYQCLKSASMLHHSIIRMPHGARRPAGARARRRPDYRRKSLRGRGLG